MVSRFQDRVALVTGGGSGIGRAAAVRLAQEGATVVVIGRRRDPLLETVALAEAAGAQALAIAADVTSEEDVRAAVAETLDRFDRLDVLVANAGIAGPIKPIDEVSLEEWEQTQAVNVRGVFLAVKHAAGPMKARGGGSIVISASNSGFVAYPTLATYCTSKGALVMFTRAVALDLVQHNIRVNSVCPGAVDTPMLDEILANWGDPAELRPTFGRLCSPEETANVIAFLASDEAAHMVGSNVIVDYGETCRPGPIWPSPSF
jgi:NAD(P)-dependent dehydrogenase (short-subunit alcohol dehydrogenase family)